MKAPTSTAITKDQYVAENRARRLHHLLDVAEIDPGRLWFAYCSCNGWNQSGDDAIELIAAHRVNHLGEGDEDA